MSDLISRSALYNALFLINGRVCPDTDVENFPITFNVKDVKRAILNAPTIEAEPVVYGEWILVSQWKDEDGVINPIYRCSACHIPNDEEDRFCKHCGADMRKGGVE